MLGIVANHLDRKVVVIFEGEELLKADVKADIGTVVSSAREPLATCGKQAGYCPFAEREDVRSTGTAALLQLADRGRALRDSVLPAEATEGEEIDGRILGLVDGVIQVDHAQMNLLRAARRVPVIVATPELGRWP